MLLAANLGTASFPRSSDLKPCNHAASRRKYGCFENCEKFDKFILVGPGLTFQIIIELYRVKPKCLIFCSATLCFPCGGWIVGYNSNVEMYESVFRLDSATKHGPGYNADATMLAF
jgi:hypothetical protein